jgi:hypothetical protein
MGFYLHIEVDSPLSPSEFRERVIVPLGEALQREGLGRILDEDGEDEAVEEGRYELSLEVTDQERAKEVVEAVLKSVDG